MRSDGSDDYIDALFSALYDDDFLRFQTTAKKKKEAGLSVQVDGKTRVRSPSKSRGSPVKQSLTRGDKFRALPASERPRTAQSKFVSKFREIDVRQDLNDVLRRSTSSLDTIQRNDNMVPRRLEAPTYNNYFMSPAVSYRVDDALEKLPPVEPAYMQQSGENTIRWADEPWNGTDALSRVDVRSGGGRGGGDLASAQGRPFDSNPKMKGQFNDKKNLHTFGPETPYASSSAAKSWTVHSGGLNDDDDDVDAVAARVEALTRSRSHQVSSEGLLREIKDCIQVRKNYLDQLLALEDYERLSGVSQTLKDISLPNFYALLVSTRSVSVRIVRNYKILTTKHALDSSNDDIIDLRKYVGAMGSDLQPLDREPFTDWTGLHFNLNPFICAYRIDGTLATTFADSSERQAQSQAPMVAKELYLDQMQLLECHELGAIVLGAHNDIQRSLKMKSTEASARRQIIKRSEKGNELIEELEFRLPDIERQHELGRSFKAWRRAYDLQLSINSMRYTRDCFTKIKVIMALQRNVWVAKEFRRILQRRSKELVSVVLGAWIQYTNWCRRFNRIYLLSSSWRKRYFFDRLRDFSKDSHSARNFKKNRQMIPLVSGFRALKWNLVINKFQRRQRLISGSLLSMGDLNLRSFIFSKWIFITKMSRGLEKTHMVSRLFQERAAFRHWRSIISGQISGSSFRAALAPASSSPSSASHTPVVAKAQDTEGGLNQDSFNLNTSEVANDGGLKISIPNASANSKVSAAPLISDTTERGARDGRPVGSTHGSWSSKLVRMFKNAA